MGYIAPRFVNCIDLSGFGSFYCIYGGINGFNGLYIVIGMYGSSASLQHLQALLIPATTTITAPATTPLTATPVGASLTTIYEQQK